MARGYLGASAEGARVFPRVSPGPKKPGIKGLYGERELKLAVAAERFLAEAVSVTASQVETARGASGRDKVALVRGVSEGRAGRALDDLLGG